MCPHTVLVAEFSHESNTFSSVPTGRTAFRDHQSLRGREIDEGLRGTNTPVGGVLDVAGELGIEVQPVLAAAATPGGVVTEQAYEQYAETILEATRQRDAIDGVLLALHGAMVAEHAVDGDGTLVRRVRDVVGEDTPIVVTLDLHGNVSDELVAAVDALVAYETYPHVDMGATGRRAMEILDATIRGNTNPCVEVERPPMIAHGPRQFTGEGPMARLMELARRLERRESILKVNVFAGFYMSDVPWMGFSVPVVADGDAEAAREAAREIAAFAWSLRDEFLADYPAPAEAVARAKSHPTDDGPVVLADAGDNPGGGSAGDGTDVLRELIEQEVTDAGIAIVRDPEVVETCVRAGVGKRVTVTLGGKTDERHGAPIGSLDGYVKAITDGTYRNTGPMGTGQLQNLGRTIRLECGTDDGVAVIVTENRVQPYDAEIWRHVGIQPERLDVLVVKSTNHYRADYEPFASAIVPVDSHGLSAIDPRIFEFERLRQPTYPLDPVDESAYPDW